MAFSEDFLETITEVHWADKPKILALYAKISTGNNSLDPGADISLQLPHPPGAVGIMSGFSPPTQPASAPHYQISCDPDTGAIRTTHTITTQDVRTPYWTVANKFKETLSQGFSSALDVEAFFRFDKSVLTRTFDVGLFLTNKAGLTSLFFEIGVLSQPATGTVLQFGGPGTGSGFIATSYYIDSLGPGTSDKNWFFRIDTKTQQIAFLNN